MWNHWERPPLSILSPFRCPVSIHAPTRGATICLAKETCHSCVSIHAPTRGATNHQYIYLIFFDLFQSTLPRGERPTASQMFHVPVEFQSTLLRGERPYDVFLSSQPYLVSIHAPTRGATIRVSSIPTRIESFNPRSHAGSDAAKPTIYCSTGEFQSTLPRGERHSSALPSSRTSTVSIHAPTRGATRFARSRLKLN